MSARLPRLARAGLLGAAVAALSLGTAAPAMASSADTHVPGTMLPAGTCHIPAHANKKVLKKVFIVARNHHVSRKVMLATFETAWVESHVNNLPCGDLDSVGVFQQRPSQGWCAHPKGCRNVRRATRQFLHYAVPLDKAHPHWRAGRIAQNVQHSKYPTRYNESRAKAVHLIKRAKRLTRLHGF